MNERPKKNFKIPGEDIKELAPGYGACFATDQITVEGHPVGYMYREAPDNDTDSGWRFFSGSEDQDYIDDLSNTEIYDVNTIANYDPDIIPFLDAPVGMEFMRDQQTGGFVHAPYLAGDTRGFWSKLTRWFRR